MSRRAARFHMPSGESCIVVFMSETTAAELVREIRLSEYQRPGLPVGLNALIGDIQQCMVTGRDPPHLLVDDASRDRGDRKILDDMAAMKADELREATASVDLEEPIPAPDWDDAD